MAEQPIRQPFRFLFWSLGSASAPFRAPVGTQPQPRSTTVAPNQQPAAVQPPAPAPLPPPKTESQPPSQVGSQSLSPSHTSPPSQIGPQAPSPSPTAPTLRIGSRSPSPPQSQVITLTPSQPPSPSRTAPTSRIGSQPPSPPQSQVVTLTPQPPSPYPTVPTSRIGSQPPSPPLAAPPLGVISHPPSPPQPQVVTSSLQPPSPSLTASQPSSKSQPLTTTSTHTPDSQHPSPPTRQHLIQSIDQTGSQAPFPTRQALPLTARSQSPPTSQPDETSQTQAVLFPHLQHYSQSPQVKSSPKPVYLSPTQNLSQPSSQLEEETNQPTKSMPILPIISEPSAIINDLIPPSESEERKDEKKSIQELRTEDKSIAPVDEEPKQQTTVELHSMASRSITASKGPSRIAPQAEKKQLEKQAVPDKKKIAMAGFKGREKKAVAMKTKERSLDNELHLKPTTSKSERTPLHKEIKEDVSRFVHKLTMGYPKQSIDEHPASIITLAGVNRGAAMHMGTELENTDEAVPIQKGYKLNQDDQGEGTDDGEDTPDASSDDPEMGEDALSTTFVNSNAQSINNSLLFDSSFYESNPGVRIVHHHNKPMDTVNLNTETKSYEAHKTSFNITSGSEAHL
ncbi:PREDICTED: vegetative cell wall protein gp1-like [Nelumbo nucifera]|uniref:Vegetative cell wall protein gp1-like n=2 Tax=Nelumbo nucifera TaxID=4432 RepID=A0A1U7ZPB5_NELNU|nr:PREDICTED: vegetative cell wall protein gp1-like [Nelumbo nucifera]DAD40754.1 TPA_asm: hypothetical protein HUJ06_015077 [Nelumbo nucifera]